MDKKIKTKLYECWKESKDNSNVVFYKNTIYFIKENKYIETNYKITKTMIKTLKNFSIEELEKIFNFSNKYKIEEEKLISSIIEEKRKIFCFSENDDFICYDFENDLEKINNIDDIRDFVNFKYKGSEILFDKAKELFKNNISDCYYEKLFDKEYILFKRKIYLYENQKIILNNNVDIRNVLIKEESNFKRTLNKYERIEIKKIELNGKKILKIKNYLIFPENNVDPKTINEEKVIKMNYKILRSEKIWSDYVVKIKDNLFLNFDYRECQIVELGKEKKIIRSFFLEKPEDRKNLENYKDNDFYMYLFNNMKNSTFQKHVDIKLNKVLSLYINNIKENLNIEKIKDTKFDNYHLVSFSNSNLLGIIYKKDLYFIKNDSKFNYFISNDKVIEEIENNFEELKQESLSLELTLQI